MEGKAWHLTAKDLYDLDFFEWTVHNAELLRAGRHDEADIERIAEELEDMGKRDRRELLSRVRVLLAHLLKWRLQPERRSPSWEETIDTQRTDIADLIRTGSRAEHSSTTKSSMRTPRFAPTAIRPWRARTFTSRRKAKERWMDYAA